MQDQGGSSGSFSPPPSFSQKRGAVISNLVLAASSLLLVFAFAEALLFLFVPPPIVWRTPQERYVCDPVLGHKLVPGQNAFTHAYPVTTNSHGFRDREYSMVPGPGTVRVLVLGDSLTFGVGAAVEDTYPKQLEAMLNLPGQTKYEVINTGVASYDTWQEVTFFRNKGVEFQPGIVVVGVYANDIVPRPSVIQNSAAGCGTLGRREFAGFIPDDVLYLLKRSRLLMFLKDRFGKLSNQFQPSAQYVHQRSLLEGSPNEFVERGWAEFESSLAEMAQLQQTHAFRLLIVVFPIAEQLVREYPNAQYQTRVKAIAEKLKVPHIDLMPKFKEEFKEFGSLFIEWDGHPNAKAHAIAASEIERYFVKEGLYRADRTNVGWSARVP